MLLDNEKNKHKKVSTKERI